VPGPEAGPGAGPDVAAVVAGLAAAGLTVAVAESLTAGQVSAALADVPGASAVLRGGVVAYATDLKAAVLGVDAGLLAEQGPVHPEVAAQMARGARRVLGASVGVATTGVAGPEPQGGQPVGTVFVALSCGDEVPDESGPQVNVESLERVVALSLTGDRAAVRRSSTAAALSLLADLLRERCGSAAS
jgi:nicotinamide-nucleotide amidase